MGKIAQLVMGPAGSGKSTYCSTIITHCETNKRNVHLVNLDPAAEHFDYKPSINIKDLITLDDVIEELNLGPNGGMVYCLEFLLENLDWFEEELNNYDDDYLIIDCPGQIELYTHFTIMQQLTEFLQRLGYKVCGIYLLDSQFLEDIAKFFSGVMSAMSAMIQLEIPHINIITKMDLVPEDRKLDIERYLDPDPSLLEELPGVAKGGLLYHPVEEKDSNINKGTFNNKYHHLTELIANLIHDYSLVSFITLDNTKEENVELVLTHIDVATQYAEDLEPKDPGFDNEDDIDLDNDFNDM